MLSGLLERGRQAGAAARARAIARGVARLGPQLPGIVVEAAEEGIVLSARGLRRRLDDDARLRWIGSLLR